MASLNRLPEISYEHADVPAIEDHFDRATESWKVYPMPRQRFFTRDIEVSEEDGAVYTTNSHFPTWQSEGGVPTLLRITPLAR